MKNDNDKQWDIFLNKSQYIVDRISSNVTKIKKQLVLIAYIW